MSLEAILGVSGAVEALARAFERVPEAQVLNARKRAESARERDARKRLRLIRRAARDLSKADAKNRPDLAAAAVLELVSLGVEPGALTEAESLGYLLAVED